MYVLQVELAKSDPECILEEEAARNVKDSDQNNSKLEVGSIHLFPVAT